VLVAGEFGVSLRMGRILKQAGQNNPFATLPILELNPKHPLVERLKDTADDAAFADWRMCCTTRPCWRKAASWTTRRFSSAASTGSSWKGYPRRAPERGRCLNPIMPPKIIAGTELTQG
jgi:hypothetical protein